MTKTTTEEQMAEDEQLSQYYEELLVEFILHGQKPTITSHTINEHRYMEKQLVSWFGRLKFWERRDQLTQILKMTGAIS